MSSSSSCELVSREDEGGKREEGIGSQVADHYNGLRETGMAERSQSRIFHMRKFNNWIKSMLIGEAISQVRRAKGDQRDAAVTVLDIGCGKGGDLRKYRIGNISRLVCTDIAATSLDQCRDRYQEMRGGRMFDCEFVVADSTRTRLRDLYHDPDRLRFDLVSVQFVMHYSFESVGQAETMLRNISENLSVGGFWIGTTTDADQLVARARRNQSPHFGNEVYSVTFADDSVLRPDQRLPLFGCKYDFHLEGCVHCPEFLLHFQTLQHMALRYGLRPVIRQNFAHFFHDKRDTAEGRALLRRMNVMERVTRTAPRASHSPGEYEHVDKQLATGLRSVGTISRSEWEAITLYLVFAFQKFRPIDGQEEDEQKERSKQDDRPPHPDRKRHASPDRDDTSSQRQRRRHN